MPPSVIPAADEAQDRDEEAASGVDVSLLRDRLRLTVTERWERNFEALKLVEAFRKADHARRAADPQSAGGGER